MWVHPSRGWRSTINRSDVRAGCYPFAYNANISYTWERWEGVALAFSLVNNVNKFLRKQPSSFRKYWNFSKIVRLTFVERGAFKQLKDTLTANRQCKSSSTRQVSMFARIFCENNRACAMQPMLNFLYSSYEGCCFLASICSSQPGNRPQGHS